MIFYMSTTKEKIQLINFCLESYQAIRYRDSAMQIMQYSIFKNGMESNFRNLKVTRKTDSDSTYEQIKFL
jgi:hypothetical protein